MYVSEEGTVGYRGGVIFRPTCLLVFAPLRALDPSLETADLMPSTQEGRLQGDQKVVGKTYPLQRYEGCGDNDTHP